MPKSPKIKITTCFKKWFEIFNFEINTVDTIIAAVGFK